MPVMKRRDVIRMSDDEVATFLQGRHTMNVATVNHDGSIHLVAMWYGFLADGRPGFWTYGRSQKVLNLERNPQLTCLVETGEEYEQLQGVELVGRGELLTDRERIMELGRSVFGRYIGTWSDEMQPYLDKTGAKRVGVAIDVTRTVSWDHRKLGGSY
jgi:PPOX class probable F420-dependent enzyme